MAFPDLSQHEPLIVLGIDPGTLAMGFGVVGRRGRTLIEIDHGVFRPPRGDAIEKRLLHLANALETLLEHHRPHVVSLEEAFLRNNVQSALRLGESRAVVMLAATRLGIPVVQYATAVAKKSVCGHGGATKEQVRDMVRRELSLAAPLSSHDATDALALALCLLADPRIDPRFRASIDPS
ncbi:MAG: crossover junction endodeoxyribonuclease RuvC [Deltaproteobacteria bacterium]|nr:crossover junction endodeoxyribonuclease RuvC [Deltaproteobacteria bacterium]